MGLLPGSLSPALAEGLTRLAAWMPFARAAEQLAFFWRVTLGPTTVRQQAEAAGAAYVAVQAAEVARLEREGPAPPAGPALLQVSADGAMVPLVGGVWAEVKTVAIGVVREPVLEDGEWRVHAADLSYFSRLTDHETFARLATAETHRRGVATAATVVGVTDGSEWLQGFLDYHCPDAVRILDLPHAVGHLAAAAQATLGPGTAATAAWLEAQAHELKTGAPLTVLAALRALPVAEAADPAAAAAARAATLGYLTARWAHIRYAHFQALGYPIGSGAVESANKLVVEARLKGSGMHWARDHVDPMLALRPVACADRWGEAWPQIAAQLRAQAAACRRQRRQARRPAVVPPPTTPPSARRRAPRPRGIPRLRPERSGRPHPWRRPLLAGGRARQATDAKV